MKPHTRIFPVINKNSIKIAVESGELNIQVKDGAIILEAIDFKDLGRNFIKTSAFRHFYVF